MTDPDPQYVALYQRLRDDTLPPAERADLVEQLHTRYLELLRGGKTTGGLPYPDPTDPVAEGADAIRSLAEAIDPRTPAAWAGGQATVNVSASVTGSTTVTLPVGRFTKAPQVVGSASNSLYNVSISALTTASFLASVRHLNESSSTTTVYVSWSASQLSSVAAVASQKRVGGEESVTCPTPGCENEGVPISIPSTYVDDEGAEHPVTEVVCGACGADISSTAQDLS